MTGLRRTVNQME